MRPNGMPPVVSISHSPCLADLADASIDAAPMYTLDCRPRESGCEAGGVAGWQYVLWASLVAKEVLPGQGEAISRCKSISNRIPWEGGGGGGWPLDRVVNILCCQYFKRWPDCGSAKQPHETMLQP